MFKKYVIPVVVAALLTPNFAVLAEDEDLQNQLSDVQNRMAQESEKKAQAEAVIGSVNDKLYAIQQQLEAAQRDYQAVANELKATEEKIAATQAELEKTRARLKVREGVFTKRVRDIYMHGQLSYLDVVLGAKDFSDFSNRLELLRRIIDADITLISDIRKERAAIETAKQELETQRARQAELRDQAAAKRDEIESRRKEQQAILYQAQNDKAVAEQAYNEYQQSSQAIAEMLRQRAADRAAQAAAAAAQASSGGGGGSDYYQPVSGSGAMIWPVNGVVTSPYGYRTHPIFGTTIYHSGIDIGVDYGTPVHAADGGVVVEAGWISGYGYAVIIDHGNGLSTLYGHNQELAVSEGQSVSQGQVIAYAGSTGNSTGPHVHFEVRANGDPVDPSAYL
ncbi:MAG: peptidoglycan DD-metalloendopeptidase family protein [Megasphaera massiliensis]|uniref:murein hydrolase activator EnvC family protein n=1 Tax=Megasphaera massiliensis TaxID=1232428 RepID=UPI00210BB7ED|nr:M23 family metallopeptidase [Megasphaera massiliensis]MCQ5209682.1 peptidoglycan DD-metalloendopeptidase family protein [Megasphaera massiliensis]MEE0658168.1 peptidoglycan DD-metalloendopeptidase family protein [Megasphaera massiliensis]